MKPLPFATLPVMSVSSICTYPFFCTVEPRGRGGKDAGACDGSRPGNGGFSCCAREKKQARPMPDRPFPGTSHRVVEATRHSAGAKSSTDERLDSRQLLAFHPLEKRAARCRDEGEVRRHSGMIERRDSIAA